MAQEPLKAELLRGCAVVAHPSDPTLAILRLDTDSGNQWCLVTRQILLALSDELKQKADEIEELQ